MRDTPPKRLLVVAGSDSSAGAGLQADLKTARHFGVYAQTAVTAVTAQNTEAVCAVQAMPSGMVRAQIEAALDDIGADAIKIGMLANADIALAVVEALSQTKVPLVLDPVLVSSSGHSLLDRAGIEVLKSQLLPRTDLVTPNLDECEALIGLRPENDAQIRLAAEAFASLGVANLLIKGGHGTGPLVRDVLCRDRHALVAFESPRQQTRHTHGTGCALSTAIACGLALGRPMEEAVREAHGFVQNAIRNAPALGRGRGPLDL